MKFGKTLVLTTLLTAGAAFALGTSDAQAAENYTVQSGDTLSKISIKFAGDNSLIDSIAKENNISNIDMIMEGQNLTIDTDAKGNTTVATVQEQAAPVQRKHRFKKLRLYNKQHPHSKPLLLLLKLQHLLAQTQQKNGSHNANQAVLTLQLTVNISDVTNYLLHT